MNIVPMVRDSLPNGYLECCRGYRTTEESQEVKVRLPLSLKTWERVRGGPTCVVPVYTARGVCVCGPLCICMCPNALCAGGLPGWRITVTWVLSGGRKAACGYVFMYVSQQKCAHFVWTRFPINEAIHQIPGIMANPEHRLIPLCNGSRLNVMKLELELNVFQGQIRF